MKKHITPFLLRVFLPGVTLLAVLVIGYLCLTRSRKPEEPLRVRHEKMLNHLNRQAPAAPAGETAAGRAADEPGMAAFHDFLMTFDPATGTVPRERLVRANETTRALASLKTGNPIIWQGYPSDMGGRTRALMYDPNDPLHKKVWAGGVTGGLWYNNNIGSASSPWIPVGDFWSNLAIRCIAYDPANPQVFFVGTGEVETAMQTYRESSGLGFGIGRSDDGGQSWYHLPGTEQFAYVTDIVVRTEGGMSVIYVGVASGLYKGSQHQSMPSDGLFRSADGGATWQQVLPLIPGSTVPFCVSDIALGADNRLYVGTRPNLDGEGAATLLWSDDGLQWNVNTQYLTEIVSSGQYDIPGRVVLATAPSDPDVVYALIASGFVNPNNGFNYFYCFHILRSDDRGLTWTKKTTPFDLTSGVNFATIAWHALDIGVDPNNPDRIFIGGLDVHGSKNGGNSWTRVSDWSLMYSGGGAQYIHADQHAIVFKPGSSSEVLFATDGGIFYTSGGTADKPVFSERNKEYSTLQFYTCALHPGAGVSEWYGGLQDNGTLYYTGTPLALHDMVTGGDGACCFYDRIDPSLSITSYYYNNYTVFVNGWYQNSISDWSSGTFVSPADLDYNMKALYCNADDYIGSYPDQVVRFNNLQGGTTATFLDLNTGSTVFFSALKYSPFSATGKATLFVGSESGRLFRVDEAQSASPVVTEIGGSAFPPASISCIALGSSENDILVTFSNYGVPSVWLTRNGGQTWQDIEGNLPDMPVRWALFHPQNDLQVMLATETGVWECFTLAVSPVQWYPANTAMANVRVDMLQVRPSDNTVLAATHGRGFFTATWDISTTAGDRETQDLSVFPVPSRGTFTISSPALEGPAEVSLTNLNGRMAWRGNFTATSHRITVETGNGTLPAGTYILTVKTSDTDAFHRKVIIE